MSCLEPDDEDARDVYTTVLTAYALALANRTEECRHTVDWLMENARRENSLTWWEKPGNSSAYGRPCVNPVIAACRIPYRKSTVD